MDVEAELEGLARESIFHETRLDEWIKALSVAGSFAVIWTVGVGRGESETFDEACCELSDIVYCFASERQG